MSKKPAKSELVSWADDILDALRDGGTPATNIALTLSGEPAAFRRDLLETLAERASKRKFVAGSNDITTLLSPLVGPGSGNKPEFAPKYVKTLFDCASALSGEAANEVCAALFLALVATAGRDGPKGSSAVSFESLGAIDGVISGFDAVLSSGSCDLLASSRTTWIPLVPEIAIQKSIPLSESGRKALVALLATNQHELPVAARLSLGPLQSTSAAQTTTVDASAAAGVVIAGAGMLPEIRNGAESLRSLLLKLSSDVEARLAAQSSQIVRAEEAKLEVLRDLNLERRQTEELRAESARLKEELSAMSASLEESSRLLGDATAELQQYKKHHGIAIANADTRESEAVARTKRGFVDAQLIILQSIRECLAELTRSHGKERAVRQAVSNFNNFSRYLSHNSYTASSDLTKIESQSGPDTQSA